MVPLDEALLNHAIDHWLTANAGLILLGPEDDRELLRHLQQLHQLVAADGLPIRFSLHAVRQLEELCEALSDDQRAILFGPIQSMLWHTGQSAQHDEWLGISSPAQPETARALTAPINLAEDDEAALDRASYAWFMRDCVRAFTQKYPDYGHAEHQPLLRQHLSMFFEESKRFDIPFERDVRHYMDLRLGYPQSHFSNDEFVRTTLLQLHVAPIQRLLSIEAHLRQRSQTAS
ncbi:hypothetical protein ACIUX1_28945 [Pseudomonas aeruginosa]